MTVRVHEGWTGVFTTDQAPGCMANGTRIEKVLWEPGDGHSVGAKGRVLGSVIEREAGHCYFVEWDAHPRYAVFVEGRKIAEVAP